MAPITINVAPHPRLTTPISGSYEQRSVFGDSMESGKYLDQISVKRIIYGNLKSTEPTFRVLVSGESYFTSCCNNVQTHWQLYIYKTEPQQFVHKGKSVPLQARGIQRVPGS